MNDRKFTPPTEFPAEYRTGDWQKAVLLGEVGGWFFGCFGSTDIPSKWQSDGVAWNLSSKCLHDLPKKTVVWANLHSDLVVGSSYPLRDDCGELAASFDTIIAVLRIEQTEGEKPQVFVEDV
jgi:hypothetical protein